MKKGFGYQLITNHLIIHIVVWLILFSLPVLFSFDNLPDTFWRYLRDWLPLFFSGLIFYLNYLFLIDRFFFTSHYWPYFLLNLITIILVTGLTHLIFENILSFVDLPQPAHGPNPPSLLMIFFRNFTSLFLTTGVAIAIKSTQKWMDTEQRQKQLEQDHLESELLNLKNQLNPHFFFNTLNNIYSLIALDQDKAQESVHRLSKMMRYLLYDSNERFVSLSKEIEFINSYIDLMTLRLSDHVQVYRKIAESPGKLQIAPLLFISLLENAFKHGVSASESSSVEITLSILPDNKLIFIVKNTAFQKNNNDLSGSGIGLKNLETRLTLLYPEAHSFHYQFQNNFFETNLTLQL